jgi:hypothetical protein
MYKMKNFIRWCFIVLGVIVIAGCASAANSSTQTPDVQDKNLPEAETAVNAAIIALAEKLNVDVDAVTLVSVEKMDWRDSCLGVTLPGQICAQAITPGYLIILDVDGIQHEVHTDETGNSVAFATQDTN